MHTSIFMYVKPRKAFAQDVRESRAERLDPPFIHRAAELAPTWSNELMVRLQATLWAAILTDVSNYNKKC